MEKETRISKYKELREEMKEEVAIDRHTMINESDDEDDDFLSFLPKKEVPREDDTLMEPLSYETLKNDNEEVKMALNEAKVNVGKEQYNTRLDILNKIKREDKLAHATTDESQKETPKKKMTLLEKLASMSPEEDVEELRKFEEGMTVADLMKQEKKAKKQNQTKKTAMQSQPVKEKKLKHSETHIEEPVVAKTVKEEPVEKESRLVKVLNIVILIFIVIFIVLTCVIIKQILF